MKKRLNKIIKYFANIDKFSILVLSLIFILILSSEKIRMAFAISILSVILIAFIAGRIMWLNEIYNKQNPPKNDDILDDDLID